MSRATQPRREDLGAVTWRGLPYLLEETRCATCGRTVVVVLGPTSADPPRRGDAVTIRPEAGAVEVLSHRCQRKPGHRWEP